MRTAWGDGWSSSLWAPSVKRGRSDSGGEWAGYRVIWVPGPQFIQPERLGLECGKAESTLPVDACQPRSTIPSVLDADRRRRLPLSGDCLWRTPGRCVRSGFGCVLGAPFEVRSVGVHPGYAPTRQGGKARACAELCRVWKAGVGGGSAYSSTRLTRYRMRRAVSVARLILCDELLRMSIRLNHAMLPP